MERNKSLHPFNTFNVQASANYFATVRSVQDAENLLSETTTKPLPKLVLGGGSNILFTKNFPGLILKNEILGIEPILEDDEHVWLTVGAGENWHQFVLYCIKHGYSGVENLSLIPGTVGAAPVQNIGAYGVEIESVFESLQAIELSTGKLCNFSHQQCQFGYRDSIFKSKFKNQFMITQVTLKLNKQFKPNISYGAIDNTLKDMGIQQPNLRDLSNAIIHIRNQRLPDPKKLPNAGSFFKNPIIDNSQLKTLQTQYPDIPFYPQLNNHTKIPAAWLIENCNLKGYKENGVGVSPNHALVLINYSSHEGSAIQKLAQTIQEQVAKKFNINIEAEVNIL